jgi:predicted PurR-regulated permease PerM
MRPIIFWIAVIATFAAVVALLRQIMLPFVAGMVLAYLLDPLANSLERLGVNRLLATLVIMAVFIASAVILIALLGPLVLGQLSSFFDNFPHYLERVRTLANDPSRPWVHKVIGEGLGHAKQSIGELTSLGANWLDSLLREIWSGGRALIAVLSLGIITPIVACYLIYDWSKMIAVIDNWVPLADRDTVRKLARQIDDAIGGFVRGQSAICLILALFYAASLRLIGLHHGLLIGLAVGLLSFVPYVGTLAGLTVSMCIAIAQFWPDRLLIGSVPVVFFVGQSLADYLLAPFLVGRRINLSPVWILFALYAFGNLFGFVGLLIAVPLAAAIGVLVRFAFAQYFASPIYNAKPAVPGRLDASTIGGIVATDTTETMATDLNPSAAVNPKVT